MGTSKGYNTPNWPDVNRSVGEAVSSSHISSSKLSNAISEFVHGYQNFIGSSGSPSSGGGRGGGSGGAARARAATSGSQLARFISSISNTGLDSTLNEFDLTDLTSKPLGEFLDSVAGRLSSSGALLDENAINYAMADTLNELTEDIDSVDEFEEYLMNNDIDIEYILQVFYAHLLIRNFEQKEYSHVRKKVDREDTEIFFQEARSLIRAIVNKELSRERDLETIDWNGRDGEIIADQINQEVLEILL